MATSFTLSLPHVSKNERYQNLVRHNNSWSSYLRTPTTLQTDLFVIILPVAQLPPEWEPLLTRFCVTLHHQENQKKSFPKGHLRIHFRPEYLSVHFCPDPFKDLTRHYECLWHCTLRYPDHLGATLDITTPSDQRDPRLWTHCVLETQRHRAWTILSTTLLHHYQQQHLFESVFAQLKATRPALQWSNPPTIGSLLSTITASEPQQPNNPILRLIKPYNTSRTTVQIVQAPPLDSTDTAAIQHVLAEDVRTQLQC